MFQGSGNYPENNLQGANLKEALCREIVLPVVANGDQILAFRVVWRETETSREAAWESIVQQRRRCDAVVRAHHGVEFFVSSITGVFTKGNAKGLKPGAIFPAVSYWMVTVSGVDDDMMCLQVKSRMCSVYPHVNIKAIKTLASRSSDVVTCFSGSLYVVLKDHRSSYIRRRVDRSLDSLGDDTEAVAPSRIAVLANSKYRDHVMNAAPTLKRSGLRADFIVDDLQSAS